jgi:hypothetical protein
LLLGLVRAIRPTRGEPLHSPTSRCRAPTTGPIGQSLVTPLSPIHCRAGPGHRPSFVRAFVSLVRGGLPVISSTRATWTKELREIRGGYRPHSRHCRHPWNLLSRTIKLLDVFLPFPSQFSSSGREETHSHAPLPLEDLAAAA